MRRRDQGTGATITTLDYQGRKVDLSITDKGIFYALLHDDRIEAKSLDGLKDKVKRAIDALGKIAIPVTLLETHYNDETPTLTDALLLRLWRGDPLVRYEDGREETSRYGETLLRRLDAQEQQDLIAAWKAYKTAETKYNDMVEAMSRNAQTLLEEAAADERS
jgi:hypothetical protein